MNCRGESVNAASPAEAYSRKPVPAYGKEQKAEFGDVLVDRDAGSPSSASGIVSIENGVTVLGDEGSAAYRFSVPSAGVYDVAVRICYPFCGGASFVKL